jgi:hypothetical protein
VTLIAVNSLEQICVQRDRRQLSAVHTYSFDTTSSNSLVLFCSPICERDLLRAMLQWHRQRTDVGPSSDRSPDDVGKKIVEKAHTAMVTPQCSRSQTVPCDVSQLVHSTTIGGRQISSFFQTNWLSSFRNFFMLGASKMRETHFFRCLQEKTTYCFRKIAAKNVCTSRGQFVSLTIVQHTQVVFVFKPALSHVKRLLHKSTCRDRG